MKFYDNSLFYYVDNSYSNNQKLINPKSNSNSYISNKIDLLKIIDSLYSSIVKHIKDNGKNYNICVFLPNEYIRKELTTKISFLHKKYNIIYSDSFKDFVNHKSKIRDEEKNNDMKITENEVSSEKNHVLTTNSSLKVLLLNVNRDLLYKWNHIKFDCFFDSCIKEKEQYNYSSKINEVRIDFYNLEDFKYNLQLGNYLNKDKSVKSVDLFNNKSNDTINDNNGFVYYYMLPKNEIEKLNKVVFNPLNYCDLKYYLLTLKSLQLNNISSFNTPSNEFLNTYK